jgi:PAS domain-containing protein
MAIEVFSGTSIPRELTTAAMEYLWAKWRTLHGTGELTLQRLTDESGYIRRANTTHMMQVGDDFVYVYVGDAMQKGADENLTGTLLSANQNPLAKEFAAVYRQVAQRMQPAFVRFTGTRKQTGELWQRLIMPVRIGDNAVCLLIYSELINHRMEVYDQLFRTAPDAMIIACPMVNDVGHTTDGWVIMMNDRARDVLKFEDSIGNLRLSQIPQFAGIDFWGRVYAPKTVNAQAPLDTATFEIELMRFPHVFGLRLRPKAAAIEIPQVDEPVTLAPAEPARTEAPARARIEGPTPWVMGSYTP